MTMVRVREQVLSNAPIIVKPAGWWRQGMGWGFNIFQKFAVKFPAHGQIIPVKCNQISPPRAAHCCQISQGWTQERYNKNISNYLNPTSGLLSMLRSDWFSYHYRLYVIAH